MFRSLMRARGSEKFVSRLHFSQDFATPLFELHKISSNNESIENSLYFLCLTSRARKVLLPRQKFQLGFSRQDFEINIVSLHS